MVGIMKTKRGTCDGCGKVRQLDRKQIEKASDSWARFYRLCSECLPKVSTKDDLIKLRQERPKKERRARFAYPCVGGPLDGEYATTDDMIPTMIAARDYGKWKKGDIIREGGLYGHIAHEYHEYNASHGSAKKIGSKPSMIFIHNSLLKPLISPKDR
jgi:hypothetical protein